MISREFLGPGFAHRSSHRLGFYSFSRISGPEFAHRPSHRLGCVENVLGSYPCLKNFPKNFSENSP